MNKFVVACLVSITIVFLPSWAIASTFVPSDDFMARTIISTHGYYNKLVEQIYEELKAGNHPIDKSEIEDTLKVGDLSGSGSRGFGIRNQDWEALEGGGWKLTGNIIQKTIKAAMRLFSLSDLLNKVAESLRSSQTMVHPKKTLLNQKGSSFFKMVEMAYRREIRE